MQGRALTSPFSLLVDGDDGPQILESRPSKIISGILSGIASAEGHCQMGQAPMRTGA